MKRAMRLLLLLLPLVTSAQSAQTPAERLDIDLEKAVSIALKNNNLLKAAYEEVNIAGSALYSSFYLQSPELGLEYKQIPSGQGPSFSQEKSYFIRQDLPFPYRYALLRQSLRGRTEVEKLRYKQAGISLKADVTKAYYAWLASRELVRIAREGSRLSDEFSLLARKQREAGEINAVALSRARITASQSRLVMASAENQETQALASLLSLIGSTGITLQPLDSLSMNADQLPEMDMPAASYLVKAAEASVKQAASELSYQKAGFLPDLGLEYMKQSINQVNSFYGVTLSLRIPVWYFNQEGLVRRNKALYAQASARSMQTVNEVENRSRALRESALRLHKNVEEYRNMLSEASNLIRYVQRSQEAGEIGYIEYLDAQRAYLDTRRLYTSTLLDYLNTLTDYKLTTGTL
jgi:outer membrane protein TolC